MTIPSTRSDPFALGAAHEASLDADERTRRGAWFTPPALARRLVDEALSRWRLARPPQVVCDPAVGAGAFLLAALERLPGAALVGQEIDPATAEVAREALARAGAVDARVEVVDGLDPAAAEPAELLLSNPPFLSQLSSATARADHRRRLLREWYGEAAAGYVDDAGLFVLAAARRLARGGVAVLIVPEALLATDAAATVRGEVGRMCDVEVVWRDLDGVFPGTPTCAIAVVKGDPAAAGGRAQPWASLLAAAVPVVSAPTTRVIADVATATADFREAYYLVADHVVEDGAGPRVTPVGLIDPAHHLWGRRPVRFAKRRWSRPTAPGLPEGFLADRLGPKVLVATQTKVIEALVDDDGDLLPTTPVVSMRTDRPWHVAAALTNPLATAVAARRHAGAARARDALKLSAKQVLALPLPADGSAAWDEAADAVAAAHRAGDADERQRHLLACGRAMCRAHELADAGKAMEWWRTRLPRR